MKNTILLRDTMWTIFWLLGMNIWLAAGCVSGNIWLSVAGLIYLVMAVITTTCRIKSIEVPE